MEVVIHPGKISGNIRANASKSAMQRACAAALISRGVTTIHNPGISNDDKAALDIIQQLGAEVATNTDGTISINGVGNKIAAKKNTEGIAEFNCGESGLSIRMFTPVAALSSQAISVVGTGSLLSRPMDFFDEVLPQLGVKCQSNSGKLPLLIQGPLQPANITIDGSLSSQFLTGLLMAYSAANASGATITVNNLKSKPYIDLTLQLLSDFGLKTPVNVNYERFVFAQDDHLQTHENSDPVNNNYTVEGDWSGAAFLLVAGAVAGSITVNGILKSSKQADKKIIYALLDAGATVKVEADAVTVSKNALMGFDFDATDCPDLFPPLVALAANCKGITRIHGLKRLKHKESDRGLTLHEEFGKLGVIVELNGDMMLIHGTGKISVLNHTLNSHHDHRIAMAMAVAALNADFPINLRQAGAIDKSYPQFYDHLRQLGIEIDVVQKDKKIKVK